MAGNPALIVRVAATIDDLKRSLAEGKGEITAAGQQMIASTIALQSRLALAEAAAQQAGRAQTDLAAAIVKGGTATQEQLAQLSALSAQYLAMKGAAGAIRDEISQVAQAAGGATAPTNNLRTALGQFDGVLASLGVNIGPEIRSLSELGDASGKTASQLGLIGTAGLVVGAGIAGWKIGRAVADFFDLDKVIGNATAKLLGFGDAAGEVAAAKADILAKASKAAGIEIKDLDLAMAMNEAEATRHAETFNTAASRVAGWRAEIEKVKADGTFEALNRDLASGNATLEELSKEYDISTRAIQFMAREEKTADDAIRDSNKRKLADLATEVKAKEEAAALERKAVLETTKLWDEYYALRVAHGGTTNEAAIAQIQRWAADTEAAAKKAGTATKAFYDALEADTKEKLAGVGVNWDLWKTKSIAALQEVADNELRTLDAMTRSGEFHRDEIEKQRKKYDEARDAATGYGKEAVAAQHAAADAAKKHTEELERQKTAIDAAKKANLDMGNTLDVPTAARDPEIMALLHSGWSLENAEAIKRARLYGFTPQLYSPKGDPETSPDPSERVPGYATGVRNAPGGWAMVGERGPEPMYVPQGANIYPSGTAMGGGVTIQAGAFPIYITQPFATPLHIQRAVDEAVSARLKSIGVRF
jgi:hypothetical protein